MEDKKRAVPELSQKEINLIEQLRCNPRIRERVEHIMEIANTSEGPLKTADQIEELLIEEMRRLGNDTMTEWATRAQERVAQELKAEDKTVLKRKKKS